MLAIMFYGAIVGVAGYFVFIHPVVSELSKMNRHLSEISAQLEQMNDHLDQARETGNENRKEKLRLS